MEKLSPLERELLLSVKGLLDGTEAEIAALKHSLADYDMSGKSAIEKRLFEIERVQTSLNQRLQRLEGQNTALLKNLSTVMESFATRLSAYEAGMNTLSGTLNKLVK